MRPEPRPPAGPTMVPESVAFAVYAMWASLLLSLGFAVHEWLLASSKIDPLVRFAIFAGDVLCIRALATRKAWSREVAVWLALVFYLLLAVDADGLTTNDLWHMLVKAPIDVFVIGRLYSQATSAWLYRD
ncbi:hypothetical protein RQP54_16050 [Curvibacter sp. APW13]|uniref:hypothetical protein n=1 Tax=Curvibacter sp. APW13 TaxID=3077236 RepID=UPI0028E04D56|nr:hypothetical protein [Curvibacter sp. APW13]MDT8992386.1 hypothetical protein [Curvibacter sp. APW13]